MLILGAAVCGFLLDLLLGDPEWMPHPVVLMGKIISRAEGTLRRRFPPTPGGEIAAGTILAALLPLGTLAFCGGVCFLALCIHPALCFAVQTLWCWQALAMRGLLQESAAVQRQLERENLPAARAAVGCIVGRDTDRLTAEGVIRAAVETVAENFCDGVAAPLLYMFLGGAPLALAYKAVNTMDSMVGYKNERYLYFGRRAARLDDAANYLPARTAALFWIAGAGLTGQSAAGAFRIWRRDRRCHARRSPPVPGLWESSWRDLPGISGSGMRSRPSGMRCAPRSRRTSAGRAAPWPLPAGCCWRRARASARRSSWEGYDE